MARGFGIVLQRCHQGSGVLRVCSIVQWLAYPLYTQKVLGSYPKQSHRLYSKCPRPLSTPGPQVRRGVPGPGTHRECVGGDAPPSEIQSFRGKDNIGQGWNWSGGVESKRREKKDLGFFLPSAFALSSGLSLLVTKWLLQFQASAQPLIRASQSVKGWAGGITLYMGLSLFIKK